jgi:type I restriction enzyme S subunit
MEIVKILKAVDIINDSVSEYEGVRLFLSTGDLNLSTIINLELHTFLEKPSRANLNVSKGDIILARMQGTVKVKVIENEDDNIIVSTGFLVLRPKINADNKFLFHLLKSSTFQNKKDKLCTGATQKAINNSNFEKLEIPLPPFATQQKIAAILDQASAIIANNRAIVNKYDALTQSMFLDMFGDPVKNEMEWGKVTLGEICHKITDGTHKTPKYLENGVCFLSAKNVKDFKLNSSDPKFISKEEHQVLSKRCNVEKLDIVITKSGSLGMAAMIEFDFEFSIFESLALVKYKREFINGLFLLYFLNTKSTQRQYNDITKGVGVKHLHLTDIRKLSIISPPIQLQNQFAERVAVIEAQKQQAQLELAKSESLFQSLLQRAFKGV